MLCKENGKVDLYKVGRGGFDFFSLEISYINEERYLYEMIKIALGIKCWMVFSCDWVRVFLVILNMGIQLVYTF